MWRCRLPINLADIRHHFYPSNQWSPPNSDSDVVRQAYGPSKQAAISKLDGHMTPEQYAPLVAAKATLDMKDTVTDSEQGRPNSAGLYVFVVSYIVVISINDMIGTVE
jgi:hypothetical protein